MKWSLKEETAKFAGKAEKVPIWYLICGGVIYGSATAKDTANAMLETAIRETKEVEVKWTSIM